VVKNLTLLFIILFFAGCASTKKAVVAESLDAIPEISGSVANAAAFNKGGSLSLGVFKAGIGASADDETDQLSAMMIRGIENTLPEDNTHFTISADDRVGSDCNLEGYIENYGRDNSATHHKLNKNETYLSIDGDIWLRDTGEKILLFQSSVVINLKTQNPKTVAYQIGVAIAHFISKESTL